MACICLSSARKSGSIIFLYSCVFVALSVGCCGGCVPDFVLPAVSARCWHRSCLRLCYKKICGDRQAHATPGLILLGLGMLTRLAVGHLSRFGSFGFYLISRTETSDASPIISPTFFSSPRGGGGATSHGWRRHLQKVSPAP